MSFQGSAEQGYLNLDAAQSTNRLHVHFPMNILDHIIDHCRFGWRLQDLLIKLEMRNAFDCFSFSGQSSSDSSACAGMWSQKKINRVTATFKKKQNLRFHFVVNGNNKYNHDRGDSVACTIRVSFTGPVQSIVRCLGDESCGFRGEKKETTLSRASQTLSSC